jgi:chromosome partitioning protein
MLIVCANSKGGVGKSTLAVHLAVWLFDRGFKTALLDTDKQRSSSVWIAEAEPEIAVEIAATHKECILKAQQLRQTHDFLIGDAPGGIADLSRTLLILADLALLPISPSILDVRSVVEATEVLREAQGINGGRPEGRLVLNKMKSRDVISRDLKEDAPELGLSVVNAVIRDLQALRDAPLQGAVVGRFGRKGKQAAADVDAVFEELLGQKLWQLENTRRQKVQNG